MKHPYKISVDYEPRNLDEFVIARMSFPWFAARFICVEDKETKRIVPLVLNQAQQRIWDRIVREWDIVEWLSEEKSALAMLKVLITILKSRQEGVSTLVDCIILWLVVCFPNIRALLVAHEAQASGHLYQIVKTAYTHMPDSVVLPDGTQVQVKPPPIVFNVSELTVDLSGDGKQTSTIYIESGEKKEKAARSFSYNIVHISEGAMPTFDDGKFILALMPALASDAVVINESTAQGIGGNFYDAYWLGKRNEKGKISGWISICICWHEIYKNRMQLFPGEEIKPKNEWERRAVEDYHLDEEQLKWARYIQENQTNSVGGLSRFQAFEQEFCSRDTLAFVSSGNAYFNSDLIAYGIHWSANNDIRIKSYSLYPKGFQEDPYGFWQFIDLENVHQFGKIDPNDVYVISADSATGKEEGDFSTAVVALRNAWGPDWIIGFFKARVNELELGNQLMWAQAVFNNAKLAPEADNMGRGMIQYMRSKGCRNIYVQEFKAEGKYKGSPKREFGFLSASAKYVALVSLHRQLMDWWESEGRIGLVVPFQELWLEYMTFVKIDGKANARQGEHDDLVTASWIASHVLSTLQPSKKGRSHLSPVTDEKKPGLTIGHLMGKKYAAKVKKLVEQDKLMRAS